MAQKSKGTAKAKAVAKAPARAKAAAKKVKDEKPIRLKAVPPVKAKAPVPAPKAAGAPAKEIAKAKAALKAATPEAKPAVETPVKAEKAEKTPRSRKISVVASANEAAGALAQKWSTLFKKSEQIEAKPYNMKAVFEEKTAIVHKILGWGYILANRNDRLEVLFKDGIKYLISNYKP